MGCGASTQSSPSGGEKPERAVKNKIDDRLANDKSAKAKRVSTDRRKTTTARQPRRPAVSTETSDDLVGKEGKPDIALVPKSEIVVEKLVPALQQHPLFEHLAVELMQQCIEAMTQRTYQSGAEVMTSENRTGTRLCLLVKLPKA